MKNHLERLATFANFSMEYQIHPIRLAEAGFYYEGNLDEVKCFACDLKHKGWKVGDDPLHIHLSLSPGCTFIIGHPKLKKPNPPETKMNGVMPHGANTSNNNASPSLNECSNNGMFNHHNPWTNETSDQASGKETTRTNGYSQTPSASTISSKSSSVGFRNVASASASSRTTNSNNGNSQKTTSSHTTSTMNQNLPQSAGISTARPRYPSYAILSVRQASYVNWPRSYRQQPNELSKAGFFYEGRNDHVRCFFCGGGLKEWEPEDDPWIEHARLFPKCVFVRQCKGEQFVSSILAGVRNIVLNGTNSYQAMSNPSVEPSKTNASVDTSMNDPAVLSVVEMGYAPNIVRKALLRLQNGAETLSAEILLRTVWELEENGEVNESENTEDSHTDVPTDPNVQSHYIDEAEKDKKAGDDVTLVSAETLVYEDATASVSSRASNSNNDNSQNTTSSHTTSIMNQSLPQSAGISTARPRYPSYAILSVRQESYVNWPRSYQQQPNELSEAGFFYEGINDHVRCFFCGGGLRDREPEDDPWIEHAQWFPKCVFVLKCKGEQFVSAIPAREQNVEENSANAYQEKFTSTRYFLKINGSIDMNDPAVLSVVEMGYAPNIVRKAALRLQNFNETTLSAEILLRQVWQLEGNDEAKESEVLTDPDVVSYNVDEADKDNKRCRADDDVTRMSAEAIAAAEKENKKLKEMRLCKVCWDYEASIVLLPCGHLVACAFCVLTLKNCPVCSVHITGNVRVIFSS